MDQEILNILKLAAISYDGKNYRDCESFCNQFITQCYSNSYVWKLKAEAINMQSGPRNPRLSEVYTCLVNYIQFASGDEREASEKNAFIILYNSYQGEMKMHLSQYEAGRPNYASQNQMVSLWNDFNQKMSDMYNQCVYQSSRLAKSDLQILFYKESRKAILEACKKTWENAVAYNYYRNDRNTGGSQWKKTRRDYSSDYRPIKSIFDTFVSEIRILQDFLAAFLADPNDIEEANILIQFCNEAIYLQHKRESAYSFKRMVETTTNEFGEIIDRTEYWEAEYYMKPEPSYINTWEDRKAKYNRWINTKKEQTEKEKTEKYWNEHPDEKKELIKRIAELQDQKKALEKDLAEVGKAENGGKGLDDEIKELQSRIASLGMFKSKEKKQLQEKLDKLKTDRSEREAAIRAKIKDCQERLQFRESRLQKPF